MSDPPLKPSAKYKPTPHEGSSAKLAFGFIIPIINSPLLAVNENPPAGPGSRIYRKYLDFPLNFCLKSELKLKWDGAAFVGCRSGSASIEVRQPSMRRNTSRSCHKGNPRFD